MPKERFEDSAFSRGLTAFMDRKDLTLEQVGNILNCTRANVFNLRTGKTAPSYWAISKLFEAGMTLEEAFGDALAEKLRNGEGVSTKQLPSDPMGKALFVKEGLTALLAQLRTIESDLPQE